MEENCSTCKRRLRLVKLDYTHGGCEHTDLEGHICLIFEDEGIAYWMVGCDNGLCEMYAPKENEND